MDNIRNEVLNGVKLVATDCDGVLTDGGLYYSENGQEMKRFHVLDGMGFLLLQQEGIKTAIITGESTIIVKNRAEKLGVDFLITGTKDKIGALNNLCNKLNISLENTVYIGDDSFDVPAIKACGFGCVPSSANEYIKKAATYITEKKGGQGCFREVADMVLEARGKIL